MAKIGSIETFDGDDFVSYQERLESYFLANDIGLILSNEHDANHANEVLKADKMKVAYMISLIGKDTYTTLKDICLPSKPTEKTFAELCNLLTDCYKPSVTVLLVAESYKFHKAKQEFDESVTMYANRLRRLAANCQFKGFLDRALRDRFVCGIRNQNTLNSLLSKDLSFQDCLAKALAVESADKEARNLTPTEYGHNVPTNSTRVKNKCFKCGSERHFANHCHLNNSGKKPNHKECFAWRNDEMRGHGKSEY